jgi:hypothetical protein
MVLASSAGGGKELLKCRALHTRIFLDEGLFDQRGCLEPDRFSLVFE